MRPIPLKLREEMSEDNFYKKCVLQDENCSGKIEFHHNLIYAGRQVNEKFCILPVCKFHHDHEKNSEIKKRLNWIMWNRATKEQIQKYSKAVDYSLVLERLNKFYGINNR